MFWSRKYGARRTEVRKNRPDRRGADWYAELKAKGVIGSLVVAGVFALAASAIVMLREDAVPYRPGQYVPQDVISRVDFSFSDPDFNFKSLRLNAVFRWEVKPGSALYAVWTRQQVDLTNPGVFSPGAGASDCGWSAAGAGDAGAAFCGWFSP